VNEYVRSAAILGDETITFAVVEPFDRTEDTFCHLLCLLCKKTKKIFLGAAVPSERSNKNDQGASPKSLFCYFQRELLGILLRELYQKINIMSIRKNLYFIKRKAKRASNLIHPFLIFSQA
jgi:hypothetical protein